MSSTITPSSSPSLPPSDVPALLSTAPDLFQLSLGAAQTLDQSLTIARLTREVAKYRGRSTYWKELYRTE